MYYYCVLAFWSACILFILHQFNEGLEGSIQILHVLFIIFAVWQIVGTYTEFSL